MTDSFSPDLLLVDGSSYLYRAFHALPALTNPQGHPTGAIYGVVTMLRKLVQTYKPKYLAVIFDAKGKTFRNVLYTDYKIHRPAMPDELKVQIEPLNKIVTAMGLPLIRIEGVEADDVIATLATQAIARGLKTYISTGDKDLAQLVNEHIILVNTMSGTILDKAGVYTKFGVYPHQIVDYLSLIGDTSDNIPGVPLVGPKTASKWLSSFGSLEGLLTQVDSLKGKAVENLKACQDRLPLIRELLTLKRDVPLDFSIESLEHKPSEPKALFQLFQSLNFKSLLEDVKESSAQSETQSEFEQTQAEYINILDEAELKSWCTQIKKSALLSVDTETTGLDSLQARLVGISLAIKPGAAAYIPLTHDYLGAPKQLNQDFVLNQLRPLLEDPLLPKLGHHLKYDINVLAQVGIELKGVAFDTLLESYILNGSGVKQDIDSLAENYLNYQTTRFEDIAGKGAKQLSFNQIALEQATHYSGEDADVALKLHQVFWPKIAADVGLKNILTQFEIPLISVLARMERRGVLIDQKLLQQQSLEFAEKISLLEIEAYQQAGQEFNLNSPKQLQFILYEKQGLPILEKTPTGQPSTSEFALQILAQTDRLAQLVLSYRTLTKLKSTYIDRLPEYANPATGRVHTSYHQAVTATGRLSSSNPNLQNIPIRTEEGRRIRQAFIVPKNYQIVSVDYSQIELRIMAHLSEDKGLLEAFKKGLDVHQATAAEVFNIPLNEVSSEQRRKAKAINFGLIYGMSAFGLARQLGIPQGQAQAYIALYFQRYPGVKKYMDTTRQLAADQGYVETVFGRRLMLPEIKSRHMGRRRAAERAAINAPLQGTAADIIKRAMIIVDQELNQRSLAAHMILQVHDELVFEVLESDLAAAISVIKNSMTQAAQLRIPLIVEVGVGTNWGEAHH